MWLITELGQNTYDLVGVVLWTRSLYLSKRGGRKKLRLARSWFVVLRRFETIFKGTQLARICLRLHLIKSVLYSQKPMQKSAKKIECKQLFQGGKIKHSLQCLQVLWDRTWKGKWFIKEQEREFIDFSSSFMSRKETKLVTNWTKSMLLLQQPKTWLAPCVG